MRQDGPVLQWVRIPGGRYRAARRQHSATEACSVACDDDPDVRKLLMQVADLRQLAARGTSSGPAMIGTTLLRWQAPDGSFVVRYVDKLLL